MQKKMYLRLFHGRATPEEIMQDWGFDGPVFGPLQYVHTTYAAHIHVCYEQGKTEIENSFYLTTVNDDLIEYEGKFYGDWSVFMATPEEADEEADKGSVRGRDAHRKEPV